MIHDIALIGSGFGGSLCATILARQGLRVLLVDSGRHPRFAIGESSTPIADLVLGNLARKYNVPEVLPLTKFGTWQSTYPQLMCGRKRGFSYYHHQPEKVFQTSAAHSRELLVAASASDAEADTHWLRADVDQFLFQLAATSGVDVIEECNVQVERSPLGWQLQGRIGNALPQSIAHCRFLIDASGAAGVLPQHLKLADRSTEWMTATSGKFYGSRVLFAHFEGVQPWRDTLDEAGISQDDYPFRCDDAALHHVLDEGWMWQLRFENDIVSVGFALDLKDHPLNGNISVEAEWQQLITRYPTITRQFRHARCIGPRGGIRRTGRLQRRYLPTDFEDANYALLPHTAGFVDPLHSTGIAHTLYGLQRLIPCLLETPSIGRDVRLKHYHHLLADELDLISQLVGMCYESRRHPQLFHLATMAYFVAVTNMERDYRALTSPLPFLQCAAVGFPEALSIFSQQLQRTVAAIRQTPECTPAHIASFESDAQALLGPYDHVGLFHPHVPNMHTHTVAVK